MIYVFGGVNIDFLIKIEDKVRMYESNPSKITLKAGGVGRNIARAIGNFKTCELISAFPNHLYENIIKDLNKHNVSTKYSKIMTSSKNSIYVDVVDSDGVVLGAADMSVIDKITKDDILKVTPLTSDEDIIVIDTNFSYDIVKFVLDNTKGYKVLDAISSKKLEKVKDLVGCFDLVKVNSFEYEIIKDIKTKRVLLTTGSGIKIIDNNKERVSISHRVLKAVNPNGCGDTLLGTYLANMDLGDFDAFKLAIVASAASSQTDEAVPTIKEIVKMNDSELDIVWKEL